MTTSPAIAVTVLGGYLGSGKTTLLNRILAASSERVAVLVNDFGDIDIDESLIVGSDGDTLTLANGCICCSLVDGFASALQALAASSDPPPRLVIEASGVSEPTAIAAYAQTPGFRLDAVVVMADLTAARRLVNDRYVGDLVRRQFASADLLIATKADLLDAADLASALQWLDEASFSYCPVVVAGETDPAYVLVDIEPALHRDVGAQRGAPADAGDRFASSSHRWDGPISRSDLDQFLAGLPASVVRLKGLVLLEDEHAVEVHVVGSRVTVRAALLDVDYSQLSAISVRSGVGAIDRPTGPPWHLLG